MKENSCDFSNWSIELLMSGSKFFDNAKRIDLAEPMKLVNFFADSIGTGLFAVKNPEQRPLFFAISSFARSKFRMLAMVKFVVLLVFLNMLLHRVISVSISSV